MLYDSHIYRMDLERDMTRRIMWASGSFKKGMTPEQLWPLEMDRQRTYQPTEEEVEQKRAFVLDMIKQRQQQLEGMTSELI